MKKLLMGIAAIALLSGGTAQAQQYGNDAWSYIDLNAHAVSFCALTQTVAGDTTNANVHDGVTQAGGAGFVFSDGIVDFDLQQLSSPTASNTVSTANRIGTGHAVLRFPGSQCNSNFIVTANSLHGGMLNGDFADGSFDNHFTNLIDYNVRVTFDDTVDSGQVGVAEGTFWTSPTAQPEFGTFRVAINTQGNGKRMLVGDYYDFLQVQMTPQV